MTTTNCWLSGFWQDRIVLASAETRLEWRVSANFRVASLADVLRIPAMGMIRFLVLVSVLCLCGSMRAQELQPRRWSHLPMGGSFSGAAYAYTSADIYFSPSLRIEDAKLDLHTFAASYLYSFELMGKSARFDIVQAYQYGRWDGLLDGKPASTSRTGLADTILRLSMNLMGAPPMEGEEFRNYRASVKECETIMGVAITTVLPTGRYLKDRLLNLGSNRVTIRPEFGIVHSRGPWSFEWDLGIYLFADNNSFYQGNTLEQDPLFATQAHVVYTFRPGLWCGVGAAYGAAGETEVNGQSSGDRKSNFLWGASIGVPVTRQFGLKLTYISSNSLERAGADSHTISLGASVMW